jgi:hypothetical protein
MRLRTQSLVGTLVIVAGFAIVAAQAPKGLEGTWKLNVSKSKFDPGPAPKSQTLTYATIPDGVRITAQQTLADGSTQTWEMSPKFDGKDYPVTGHPNADTISLGKADGLKSESTFKKGGKVVGVNTRTLSADGKTLTIVTKGTDEKGRPTHNTQVFER